MNSPFFGRLLLRVCALPDGGRKFGAPGPGLTISQGNPIDYQSDAVSCARMRRDAMPLPPAAVNVATNLSCLCDGRSIAELCRAVGINRQQFNKYLSGQHAPSRRNLGKLCSHFSVSAKDLYRDPAEFAAIHQPAHNQALREILKMRRVREFASAAAIQKNLLRDYIGYYDRYQYTPLYPGKILRASLRIYEMDNSICYHYVERFPDIDLPHTTAYVFKYHGLCLWKGDRIFMIDVDASQKNDMTFSILIPVTRNAKRFLYGLMTGVAATFYREPFATKIVLEFKGEAVDRRKHMRTATATSADDKSIPSEVMNYLGRLKDSDQAILRGR
jgi:hypothetical protein